MSNNAHIDYSLGTSSGAGRGLGFSSDGGYFAPGRHLDQHANLYNFLHGDAASAVATSNHGATTQGVQGGLGSTTDGMIRAVGLLAVNGGDYDVRIHADDGYRLRIGGVEVGAVDHNQALTQNTYENIHLGAGAHQVELLYWDQGLDADIKIELKSHGADDSTYQVMGSGAFALFSGDGLTPMQDIGSDGHGGWQVMTGVHHIGSDQTEQIDGSAGRDVIDGRAGDDSIAGHDAADQLYGGDGNDHLDGGDGDDRLIGGLGSDILTGGEGQDTFLWFSKDHATGAHELDTVTDFSVRNATSNFISKPGDILDLSDLMDHSGHASVSTLLSRISVDEGNNSLTLHIHDDQQQEIQTVQLDHFDWHNVLGLDGGAASSATDALRLLEETHQLILHK